MRDETRDPRVQKLTLLLLDQMCVFNNAALALRQHRAEFQAEDNKLLNELMSAWPAIEKTQALLRAMGETPPDIIADDSMAKIVAEAVARPPLGGLPS